MKRSHIANNPWIAVVIWLLVIWAATSMPGATLPSGSPGIDKVVHFILYTPLGWLLLRALSIRPSNKSWQSVSSALVIGMLAAGLDEWHQQYIAGRSASITDWLWDCIGTSLGCIMALHISLRYQGGSQMGDVRAITADEYEATINSTEVVLLKFYTQGCPACARFAPTFEKLADEYIERANLVQIDARQNMDIAKKLGIRGVPTVVAFKGGEEAQRLTGTKSLAEMREWLTPLLPEA